MLGIRPLPRTLDAAVRDISSTRVQTRAEAAGDLVRHALGSPAVRARAIPLLEKLMSDEAPFVRAAAAVALGDIEAREALPTLLVALEDGNFMVRQKAINALGEIGDERAAVRLERAVKDEKPEVRYQAVIAYTRVKKADGAAVLGALRAATADRDAAVRYIGLRIAEELFDEGRLIEVDDLARIAGALLADDSGDVVLAAAIFLAKTGDERGRSIVADVVRGHRINGKKPSKEDERAAVELAGELNAVEVRDALVERAWGVGRWVRDTCEWSAKVALAAMGNERAIAEFARDLESTRRPVVDAAVVAVGRARIASLKGRLESLQDGYATPELVAEALARFGTGV